jgi:hypothetical protein
MIPVDYFETLAASSRMQQKSAHYSARFVERCEALRRRFEIESEGSDVRTRTIPRRARG